LAGCGGGSSGSTGGTTPPGPSVLTGVAMGGLHPIAGSTVTAYAAGATTGGSATRIGQATTDSHGAFSLAAFNPAPASGQWVYLVAQGGDAGGGANSATRLMTVAGAYCATAPGCSFPTAVTIDELTTVGSVYSLAQFVGFGGGAAQISGTAPGLPNAVAAIGNLVDSGSGQSAAFLNAAACSGSSAPANCVTLEKLDTLANIAAACVGSSGPASTACAGLFAHSGSASDTLGALYNIATLSAARQDASGIAALAPSAPVYSPALTAAPNDWTLALTFSGGGLSAPAGVAIDAAGNVWVADNTSAGAVSELSPTGAALSPAAGYTGNGLVGPLGLAIDSGGQVWVANWGQGSGAQVSGFNANGSVASGSPYSGGGILGPIDLAIGPTGEVWVANYGNSSVTRLGKSGAVLTGPITGHGLDFPSAIALDNSGEVWVLNQSGNSISEFDSTGAPVGSSAYIGGGLDLPYGIGLDPQGDVWAANQSGQSVSKLIGGKTPPSGCPATPAAGDTGCALSPSAGFKGGGLTSPLGVAIDSAGQVWLSNFHGASITELAADGTAQSPSSGYTGPGMAEPYGLAVDASGNVWVASFAGASVTEFIGLAAPVVTPKIGLPQRP